jgi:hypothetical protein
MRGSRVAESLVFCRRPLEPDAGNAAEGSEEFEVRDGLPVISALRFPGEPRITRMNTDQMGAVIPSPECFRGEGPRINTKRFPHQ